MAYTFVKVHLQSLHILMQTGPKTLMIDAPHLAMPYSLVLISYLEMQKSNRRFPDPAQNLSTDL